MNDKQRQRRPEGADNDTPPPVEEPQSSMRLEEMGQEAEDLLDLGDEVFDEILSGNSAQFVQSMQQQGGQ